MLDLIIPIAYRANLMYIANKYFFGTQNKQFLRNENDSISEAYWAFNKFNVSEYKLFLLSFFNYINDSYCKGSTVGAKLVVRERGVENGDVNRRQTFADDFGSANKYDRPKVIMIRYDIK
jgi:hypothetical protein